MANIITGTAIEGSAVYLLARINGGDGGPIDQASIAGLSVEIWKTNPPLDLQRGGGWSAKNIDTPTPIRFKAWSPLVADCVFDSLQTDPRWTKDAEGYNFRLQLGAADFDVTAVADYQKAQWYEATIKFSPDDVAWQPFKAVYALQVFANLFGK